MSGLDIPATVDASRVLFVPLLLRDVRVGVLVVERGPSDATLSIDALLRLSARSRNARFRRVASRYALGEAPSTPENAYDRVLGQTRIAASAKSGSTMNLIPTLKLIA